MDSDVLKQQARCISHEIRNQLSICDVYSEIIRRHLAKENIDNPSINNALNCIQKSVKLIGNSLMDLKSISNIVPKIYDSNKLIIEAVNMSKIYIQDKKIDFAVDLSDSVNIFVDDNKFQACIINVIKNAIESISKSGIIKIVSKIDNNNLLISISNNGKPISPKAQNEIFSDGFTTKKTGSGIGLYLCKQNLQAFDGDINLISSDSKHTVFEISVSVKNV